MAQSSNPTQGAATTDLAAGLDYPPSKGTKPVKYTPKTVRRLLEAISNGMSLRSACVVAGIAPSTLTEWHRKYTGLNDRIDKAREIAREKLLKIIKVAAVDDWRAAAELLKLSYPQDYRRPGSQGNSTYNTQVNTAVTISEERLERMAQRGAELRAQWQRVEQTTKTPAQRQALADRDAATAGNSRLSAERLQELREQAERVRATTKAPAQRQHQRPADVIEAELVDAAAEQSPAEPEQQPDGNAEQPQQQREQPSSLYTAWLRAEPAPYDADEPAPGGNRGVPRLR
jgi:hypothetical protein